jgi:hypothetical protein
MENFLAEIGGTLGLWAGFSVLTGAEIALLVINVTRLIMGGIICPWTWFRAGNDKKKKYEDAKHLENAVNSSEKPEVNQMLEESV